MDTSAPHHDLETALSLERFNRYVGWASGDRNRAVELYTLNTRLSEALYIPLQMLEVALRNRIHAVMSTAHHEEWFNEEWLGERQLEQVAKANEDIRRDKKEPTPGRLVAELTFSFWTAMLGSDYEQLWQTGLHQIARKPNGKGVTRKQLSGPLTPIRVLRNRIAHHEPIIKWDLPKHYGNMVQITSWLSPAAAEWCIQHCRFDEIYPAEKIILNDE